MWCHPPHCIMGNLEDVGVGESDATARALHESLIMLQSRTCGPTTHRLKQRPAALSSSFSDLCLSLALSYGSWGKTGTTGWSCAVNTECDNYAASSSHFYLLRWVTQHFILLWSLQKHVSFELNFDVFFIINILLCISCSISLRHECLIIFSTHMHNVHVAHNIV